MLQLKASLSLILGGSCLDWDLFIMRKYSFFKVNESVKMGLIILEDPLQDRTFSNDPLIILDIRHIHLQFHKPLALTGFENPQPKRLHL